MAKDYYDVLGIDKKASKADIKKAFRNAAKKHHPDKGGDAEKFKEINEAYETLGDDQKKSQYDQFGSAGPNMSGFGGFGGGGFQGGAQYNVNFDDIGDVFSSFFGGGFGNPNRPRRGSDLEVEVTLDFDEAMKGTKKSFRSEFGNQKKIEIEIPEGINNGDVMKMRGRGDAGVNGGPAGDLYIHIRVKDSADFQRRGLDLISTLDISVFEALLGGKHKIKTFWGKMELTVPELTRDGQLLRVTGKGVKKGEKMGDHIVRIQHVMPKKISKKLREAIEAAKKAS